MAAAGETSIKDLVRKTVADGQRLVKAQLALTQAELTSSGQALGRAGILVIVAIGCIALFSIFLLITIAYVFVAIGLPVWAGFGLVSLLLLITAGVAGLLAKQQADRISAPKIALAELAKTQQALAPSDKAAPTEKPGQ